MNYPLMFLMISLTTRLILLPDGFDVHGMDAISSERIYVCGKGGTVFYTHDGGNKWERVRTGFNLLLTDIEFIDEKNGWVVGERGIVLFTDDGGKSWKLQRKPSFLNLLDVFFLDNLHGWAVGDWGEIIKTYDGGNNWSEIPLKLDARERGVFEPVAAEEVFEKDRKILVKKGERIPDEILKRIDSGEIKAKIRNDVVLNSVLFFDKRNGVVAGEGGKFFITKDGGKNFIEFSAFREDFYASIFSLAPFKDFIVMVGGGGKMLKVMKNTGRVYEEINSGIGERDVYSIDIKENTFCLAGNDGLVAYSFDGGKSFLKFENREISYLWFRRAVSPKDGVCIFGGKKGRVVVVEKNGH